MSTAAVEIGSVRRGFGLALGAGLMVLAVVSVVVLRPNWRTIQQSKQQIELTHKVLAEARAAVPQIEAYEQSERDMIQALVARARQQIPDDEQLPLLLNQLQTAARRAGMENVSISTQRPQPLSARQLGEERDDRQVPCRERGCWRVPVSLSGSGEYLRIANLLDQLARCERLVTVSSVRVENAQGDGRRLGFELQLDAYCLGAIEGDTK